VKAKTLRLQGYSSGDPIMRNKNGGALHALAMLALLVLEVATAFKVLGKPWL